MKAREEEGATVFREPAHSQSWLGTQMAMALWLGAIHFNVLLIMASLFLFPRRVALLVLGMQLLFMFVPVNGKSEWGRSIARFISKHAVCYFPITLHVEQYQAFDSNRSYVFGYEPHSALPLGAWVLTDLVGFMPIPKIKIITSSTVFYVPFMRQIWTWLGSVPASREMFSSQLRIGYSCVVSPGGLRETLHMDLGSEVAFIKSRKGFVRIAMQNGSPLVPVFCFGTPIPFASPLHVFVGKPIEIERKCQPTTDEVNEVHAQYVTALQELFENNKARAGYPDVFLRII